MHPFNSPIELLMCTGLPLKRIAVKCDVSVNYLRLVLHEKRPMTKPLKHKVKELCLSRADYLRHRQVPTAALANLLDALAWQLEEVCK